MEDFFSHSHIELHSAAYNRSHLFLLVYKFIHAGCAKYPSWNLWPCLCEFVNKENKTIKF